jgi:hypothetical protein
MYFKNPLVISKIEKNKWKIENEVNILNFC